MTVDISSEAVEPEEKLRQQYRDEGWGKLAEEAGFDPIHTESAAREAFRFAYEQIKDFKKYKQYADNVILQVAHCEDAEPNNLAAAILEGDLLDAEPKNLATLPHFDKLLTKTRNDALGVAARKAFALGAPKAIEDAILALIEGDTND